MGVPSVLLCKSSLYMYSLLHGWFEDVGHVLSAMQPENRIKKRRVPKSSRYFVSMLVDWINSYSCCFVVLFRIVLPNLLNNSI